MFSRTIHLNISTGSLHLHRIFMFWWNSKWFSAFCFKFIELLKYEYAMEAYAYELGRLRQSVAFVFYPFLPKVTETPMLMFEGDVWKCVTFERMNSCLTFRFAFASSYHISPLICLSSYTHGEFLNSMTERQRHCDSCRYWTNWDLIAVMDIVRQALSSNSQPKFA